MEKSLKKPTEQFFVVWQDFCETEIRNLYIKIIIQKDILGF